MKFVCPICGYVYDEAAEGTPFADLPDSWTCPLCRAAKSAFLPEQRDDAPPPPETPAPIDAHMRRLSAGELSALCSNLARGCEKQYREQDAARFRQLADHFAAAVPDLPDASVERLAACVQADLAQGYPALRAAAVAEGDRGTQRICVWGEKVTRMLEALLSRWAREGDAFLRDTGVWVCSVCGFIYIGDAAPALCPVCKVPAWKFERIEGRATR